MEDICTCKRCPCCGKLVQPLVPLQPYTPPAPVPYPWDVTPYPIQPYTPPIWTEPFRPIWIVDFSSLPQVTC